MYNESYLSGLFFSLLAGTIWGCIQVIYFNHINYIPPLEIIAHRSLWAFFILFFVIISLKNFKKYLLIFNDFRKIFFLSLTALLVSSNWFFFILAVSINKVNESAMGYFISPIFSVAFGYIFFKEKLSKIQLISLLLIIIAIINLIVNLGVLPWISLSLATTWSIYGLIRKKIDVSSEIGLLFETSFLAPFFFTYIIFLKINGIDHFKIDDNYSHFFLIGAGIVTLVPLFFFNLGVKKIPLGIAGLIFYLVPTLQFLTSITYLNEEISYIKLISFIIIWISIIIFIYDSFKKKNILY